MPVSLAAFRPSDLRNPGFAPTGGGNILAGEDGTATAGSGAALVEVAVGAVLALLGAVLGILQGLGGWIVGRNHRGACAAVVADDGDDRYGGKPFQYGATADLILTGAHCVISMCQVSVYLNLVNTGGPRPSLH